MKAGFIKPMLTAFSLVLATGFPLHTQDPKGGKPVPQETAAPGDSEEAPAKARPSKAKQAKRTPRKKTQKIPYELQTNLNAASREELRKLPGINDEAVARIVANRPYKTKADLVVKGALPIGLYLSIKDRVAAGPGPK